MRHEYWLYVILVHLHIGHSNLSNHCQIADISLTEVSVMTDNLDSELLILKSDSMCRLFCLTSYIRLVLREW